MAVPVTQSRGKGSQNTDTKNHPGTLPSSISTGNLLLAVFGFTGDPDSSVVPTATTTSDGWAKLGQASEAGFNVTEAIFYRWAGDTNTLVVNTDTDAKSSHIIICVSGAGAPITASSISGSSSNSDPANLSPGTAADYLWVAARAGTGSTVPTAAPTSYAPLTNQAGGSTGVSVSTAERAVTNDTSDNPAAFTVASKPWVCHTIGIPAGTAPPPTGGGSGGGDTGGGDVTGQANPSATHASILNIGTAAGKNHFNIGIGYPSGHVDYSQAQIMNPTSQMKSDWVGYFDINPTNDGILFSAPLNGKTTSTNTKYARSELREYKANGVDKADWDGASGRHYVEWDRVRVRQAAGFVSGSTSNGPRVVVLQVHAASDDACKIVWFNGKVTCTYDNAVETAVLATNVAIDQWFYVKIEVIDGDIKFWYGADRASATVRYTQIGTALIRSAGQYFKAGCYNQANTTNGTGGPFIVEAKGLVAWHTGDPDPVIGGGGTGGGGGTTPTVPGQKLNLSKWYLTLPNASSDPGDTGPQDVYQPELNSFTSSNFLIQGTAVKMIAPVQGETTSSASGSTRCEYREMAPSYVSGTDPKANWGFNDGDPHRLTVTMSADATGVASGGRKEVIVGQIHDTTGTPPIYLLVNQNSTPGALNIFKNGPSDGTLLTGIGATTVFTYDVFVDPVSHTVKISACLGSDLDNLVLKKTYPFSDFSAQSSGCYFKAGVYNKETIDTGRTGQSFVLMTRMDLNGDFAVEPGTGGGGSTGGGVLTYPMDRLSDRWSLNTPEVSPWKSGSWNVYKDGGPVVFDGDNPPGPPDNPDLDTFVRDSNQQRSFKLTPSKDAIIMSVDYGGATTSGSANPRMELREMTKDGLNSASWSNTTGEHKMCITTQVDRIDGNDLVIGQIHGASDDLTVFRVIGTSLYATRKDDNTGGGSLGTITLGKKIRIAFRSTGGVTEYFYDPDANANASTDIYSTTFKKTSATYTQSDSGCYFKAGAYLQKKGGSTSWCQVTLYDVNIEHTGSTTALNGNDATEGRVSGGTSGGGTGSGGSGGTGSGFSWPATYPDGLPYAVVGRGSTVVNCTPSDFASKLSSAASGQKLVLANGTYSGDYTLSGKVGSLTSGISIVAANKGQAIFTSSGTCLTLTSNQHVYVEGLVFTSEAPGQRMKIAGSSTFVQVSRCTFGPSSAGPATSGSTTQFIYVGDTASKVRIDHNLFRNKGSIGNCIQVYGVFDTGAGCKYIRIDHNLFKSIKPDVSNNKEPIRFGVSTMQRTVSSSVIERNFLIDCFTEPELISVKMCKVRVTGNTIWKCAGGPVLRLGTDNILADNYVIDGSNSTAGSGLKSGGARFYDRGHTVAYNYFSGIAGANFQASLLLDTSDAATNPTSTADGHYNVRDALVQNNVILNSNTGMQVGDNYGANPYNCTIKDNLTAGIATGTPPLTFIGSTLLDSSPAPSGNLNATTPEGLGMAMDSDNIWRKGNATIWYGPRISFIKETMVGPDADLDDSDGTGPGIGAAGSGGGGTGGGGTGGGGTGGGGTDPDPDPDTDGPDIDPDPEPENNPPVLTTPQIQLPKTWYLGPSGNLNPLTVISTDAEIQQVRYGGSHQGLSGARTVDTTGFRLNYTLSWRYLDEEEYQWLEALYVQTQRSAQLRLIDPMRRNRLSLQASRNLVIGNQGSGIGTYAPYAYSDDWPAVLPVPGVSLSLSKWTTGTTYVRYDPKRGTTLLNLEQITGSVYLRALTSHNASIGFEYYNTQDEFISSTSEQVSVTNQWQRFSLTRTGPAKAAKAVFRIDLGSFNTHVRVAAPQVETGTAVSNWQPGGGSPIVVIDQMPVTTPRFPMRNVSVTLLEV